jgi:hypothetical protein
LTDSLRSSARILWGDASADRCTRAVRRKVLAQSEDLQTLFTIDGEGVFVLDTGATTFILTVPDRFSCRIEGG